jgi:hypothetical protein
MLDKKPNLKGLIHSGSAAKADAVAESSETPAKPIDFSHIGGKRVGHHVPVKGAKEISFEHLGGRCIRRSLLWMDSDHPMAEPAESVEKEDDARE